MFVLRVGKVIRSTSIYTKCISDGKRWTSCDEAQKYVPYVTKDRSMSRQGISTAIACRIATDHRQHLLNVLLHVMKILIVWKQRKFILTEKSNILTATMTLNRTMNFLLTRTYGPQNRLAREETRYRAISRSIRRKLSIRKCAQSILRLQHT